METFLLLWDELDDAATSLRLLWPQFFGFFLALALFVATVLALMYWPLWVTVGALTVAMAHGLSQPQTTGQLHTDP